MPCFACYGCGKCLRANTRLRRCVACHERLAPDVTRCPVCGALQPLPPGASAEGGASEAGNAPDDIRMEFAREGEGL